MTDRARDTLRIATEIQRAESLEQMLSIVLRHVGAWVRYDRAAIALSDAAGNYLFGYEEVEAYHSDTLNCWAVGIGLHHEANVTHWQPLPQENIAD